MSLATATPDGKPSVRIVLLKGFDQDGFVFFTNYESEKGQQLDANPNAALGFYWIELDRQIRINGPVAKTSREESERYFHSRPLGSQLGAWASRQSEVIDARRVLDARLAEMTERYKNGPVPLPSHWGGYRLSTETMEFWQGRANRLHDRFLYKRREDRSWCMDGSSLKPACAKIDNCSPRGRTKIRCESRGRCRADREFRRDGPIPLSRPGARCPTAMLLPAAPFHNSAQSPLLLAQMSYPRVRLRPHDRRDKPA